MLVRTGYGWTRRNGVCSGFLGERMGTKRRLERLVQLAAVMGVAAWLTVAKVELAWAGEPPAEPFLRLELGMHVARIDRIAADDAGHWLVTASTDKTARVWNLATGQ